MHDVNIEETKLETSV